MNNIVKMFELQDKFNQKVHPEWKTQDFAFDEAIVVESGELLEHLGYKWWKSNFIDINQAVMEMVDIWHFGMSHMIISNPHDNYSDLAGWLHESEYYRDVLNEGIEHLDIDYIKQCIMFMINVITDAEESEFDVTTFLCAWHNFGLDLNDLYKKYVGKNALNEFRQNNGYKSGLYIKIWNGREDNEYLTDILNSSNIDDQLYSHVMEQLESIYKSVK